MYVNMIQSFAKLIVRQRWLFLLLPLVLVSAAGAGLSKLKLSSDLEVFFAPDDPELTAYNSIRNTYSRDDNLFLVLVPPQDTVFSSDGLALLQRITEDAWRFPYALRVDSIANFQHTEADADDLKVQALVNQAEGLTPAQIDRIRSIATSEPLLLHRLITETGNVAAINISVQFPEGLRAKGIPELMAYARDYRKTFEQQHPGAELLITGKVAGNNAFTEASIYDITHIVPIALLIALGCIAVYMYLASGNLATAAATTFATICVVFSAVIVGMGMAGWLNFSVTPPLVNAPTVILTLAVADCMHLMVTYFHGLRTGQSREAAVVHTLQLNFQAVLLTSVTTVIGFLALNSSESPPFQDLGNVVAIGIVAAWMLSMSLLPALMLISPSTVRGAASSHMDVMNRLAGRILLRPVLSFTTVTAVILLAAAFVPKNELYDVWAEYFHPSTQIRADSDRVRSQLNGFNIISYNLSSGEAGGVADPDYLRRLDQFSHWLLQQPEVRYVNSFSDIMKRLNRNMHGDDPDWHRLPEQRELAAQYLLLYEFSLPFGLDLTNQVDLDKGATRMTAGLRSSSTKEILALQARAEQRLEVNTPEGFYLAGASSDTMFAHIGQRNVKSMLLGSFVGLLAISLVVAGALRSVSFGVISLLLNVLPILVGFGVWGLLVGRVGLGLSAVSGLTMGIVVDYTVHLLSKYQHAQRSQSLGTEQAIRYAFSTVGVALVVTTVVLCVNFGLLALSVFTLNRELGVLTAGIILIALLIDLFFLPPVLLWMGRADDRRAAVTCAAGDHAV